MSSVNESASGRETVGYRGQVACRPFKARDVQIVVKNGVGHVKQKIELESLEVVFGDGDTIRPGDFVWMDSDLAKSYKIVDVLGQQVVLCKPEAIRLVTRSLPGTTRAG